MWIVDTQRGTPPLIPIVHSLKECQALRCPLGHSAIYRLVVA